MVGRLRRSLFALYLASAVFVTVQQGVVGRSNNFKVFRAAAVNLLAHRDLYAAHPDQHFDFYKYSPTFALLFAPLAALPFAPALLIWSLLNSLLLWHAVRRLLPERQATLALALVYLEVLFAMQYTQSNGLVTALILLAFLALEQGRQLGAALLIGVDTFVKIFPLGAVALALFHPRRWRFLCSLLIYLVLFNHQSERASFVIAYTGLSLWYAASAPDPVRTGIALLAGAALLLQDVQILPWAVHDALGHYRVKGIPCLLAWVVMQAELLGWRPWSPRSHRPEVGQAHIPPPEPLASR